MENKEKYYYYYLQGGGSAMMMMEVNESFYPNENLFKCLPVFFRQVKISQFNIIVQVEKNR